MTFYGATDRTLVAEDGDGNILFLQLRTGRLAGGNGNVAAVWMEFERTPGIELDSAITAAATRIGMDRGQLGAQMEKPLAVLMKDGIITTRPPGSPSPRLRAIVADEADQPARREPADDEMRVPRRVAIAAAAGLAIALVLKPLPFWAQLQILLTIRRLRPRRAGLTETRLLAAAVKRAARHCPGPTECLEQSLGTFIAGALTGAPPDWCHGGSLMTDTYHAWVQAGRTAVDYTDQCQDGASLVTFICLLVSLLRATGDSAAGAAHLQVVLRDHLTPRRR
jgi:hypothetical protein